MNKHPIILIIGTRPEGIKLMPVYFALKEQGLPVKICATFQHTNLLQEVFDLFGTQPDFSFDVMQKNQDLFHITQAVLEESKKLFNEHKPQLVVVQGDTTSGMAASLAAFYLKLSVVHIEAGLRTGNIQAPFPEELNRQFISLIAKYNFAPTQISANNLRRAGVSDSAIYQVGNTVVDALYLILNKIDSGELQVREHIKNIIHFAQDKKLILLTMHRREMFGEKMIRALSAIKQFAMHNQDVYFIFPIHPNPNVGQAVEHVGLGECKNIFLVDSLPYHELIYVLDNVQCVATDSGGIQEEAASLGKPVVVLRNETDRPESVQAGIASLAGCDVVKIHLYLQAALQQEAVPTRLYGDGNAAKKIATILKQETTMVKVAVVGLGYVGLPTAIVLAEAGFDVLGYDIDVEKIAKIKRGEAVIEEFELGERLAGVLSKDNFEVSVSLGQADYFIITVPTPIGDDKKSDLSYVWSAVRSIATKITTGSCVIVESTVPVGTTKKVAQLLEKQTGLVAGKDFFVAFSPERVMPGKTFSELVHNDRLVGGINSESSACAKKMYERFVKSEISTTSTEVAEMVKLVENSSRDVQIAFANQVASMAESAGMSAQEVITLANKHPRVSILNPGCGVGGHCIAVDPWFLIESFPGQTKLLQAARNVNDAKPQEVLDIIKQKVFGIQQAMGVDKVRVCVLGVTYKPDVDDLRNSPAFYIAQELQRWAEIDLEIVDPYVDATILQQCFNKASYNAIDSIEGSDLTIALVAHAPFKKIFEDSFVAKNMLSFCELKFKHGECFTKKPSLHLSL